MYTLCQRLIDDESIGFNYDYMGAAEYEFGATREARKRLNDAARLDCEPLAVKVDFFDRDFNCVAIFAAGDDISPLIAALKSGEYRNKGPMAYPHRPPSGWLVLDPVPAIIHMDTDEGAERAQRFIAHARELLAA